VIQYLFSPKRTPSKSRGMAISGQRTPSKSRGMAISGQKRTPSYEAIIYDQVKNLILSLLDIGRTKMKTTAERMADYLRVFETRDPRSMAELYSKKLSFIVKSLS
jgi:hypothetical protein